VWSTHFADSEPYKIMKEHDKLYDKRDTRNIRYNKPLKSALPMPTIMIDIGKPDACTHDANSTNIISTLHCH